MNNTITAFVLTKLPIWYLESLLSAVKPFPATTTSEEKLLQWELMVP